MSDDFVGHAHLQKAARVAADYLVPVLVIVLIPVFATIYLQGHNAKVRMYDSQIAACERGNKLRDRINTKFEVYDTAFDEISKALKAAKTPVGKRLYVVTHAAVVTQPQPLPLTECREIYDDPRWFWQDPPEPKPAVGANVVGPSGATGNEGGKG